MEVIGIVIAALLGVSVGSFLNVCIDRLPNGGSLFSPPSHCPSCNRRLTPIDLVPIFSYLKLCGRCRYCQAAIPKRILWVEIVTGTLFILLYRYYGVSFELLAAAFYCCLFVILAVIDLEHGLVLNKVVYPSLLMGLAISIFLPPSRVVYPHETVSSYLTMLLPTPGIIQSTIGGAFGFGAFLLIVLISRGGMGWGDVKMAGLVGIATGYLVFVALFLAVVLGGVIAVSLLLLKVRKRKESLPFAPFLSLAAIITLLFGTKILIWYLTLF